MFLSFTRDARDTLAIYFIQYPCYKNQKRPLNEAELSSNSFTLDIVSRVRVSEERDNAEKSTSIVKQLMSYMWVFY